MGFRIHYAIGRDTKDGYERLYETHVIERARKPGETDEEFEGTERDSEAQLLAKYIYRVTTAHHGPGGIMLPAVASKAGLLIEESRSKDASPAWNTWSPVLVMQQAAIEVYLRALGRDPQRVAAALSDPPKRATGKFESAPERS